MDKMTQWRDGLLSDSEIMAWLIHDLAEVQQSMYAHETKIADERCERLGIKPTKNVIIAE